jgi:hypothetical protein
LAFSFVTGQVYYIESATLLPWKASTRAFTILTAFLRIVEQNPRKRQHTLEDTAGGGKVF